MHLFNVKFKKKTTAPAHPILGKGTQLFTSELMAMLLALIVTKSLLESLALGLLLDPPGHRHGVTAPT